MDNFESKNDILSENMTGEQPVAENVTAETTEMPEQQPDVQPPVQQPPVTGYAPYGWQPPYYDPYEIQKQYYEKQWVRRIGNSVGFPLSMFIILGNALTLILQYVVIAIFGMSKAIEVFSDPDMLYLQSACFTVFLLTVPYLFTIKRTNLKPSEFLPFKKVGASKSVTLIMAGIGVCAVSNYATAVLASFLEQTFGMTVESSMVDFGTGPKSFILMLLCVGLLPALLEEFALRGVILGALRKKFSDGMSIVISASLFGLLHGNLQQIPFAFGVGMILGYATVYSGSLVPAMIIHGFNNCLSVVMTFATRTASPMLSTVIMLLYYAVSLLVGICGFIMLMKTDKNALKLSPERKENTARNLGWLVSSPWIIVFIVLCVLEVVAVQAL